ncbi:MAG TPA: hypothetical protein VF511_11010, partial [Chthoniobacterales bacterium]
GQEVISRVTGTWLRAHEAILGSLVTRSDVEQVSDIDEQMERAVRKNRAPSRVGWFLFLVGIVLQVIPHFRHDGWRALCEPLFNLCAP